MTGALYIFYDFSPSVAVNNLAHNIGRILTKSRIFGQLEFIISLMLIKKSKGPRINTCGTPLLSVLTVTVDTSLFHPTECLLSRR